MGDGPAGATCRRNGQPFDPARFPGNSVEQLERMTDLLLNYDWYWKQQQSIRELVDDAGAAADSA